MSEGFFFDSSSLTLYRGSVIIQVKRKIARNLFEQTDLSLQQIAKIVELDRNILEREFTYDVRPTEVMKVKKT